MAALVGRVAFALHDVGREDDVAVSIVDGEHAFRAHGAHFKTVDRPGPDFGQGP